MVDIVEKSSISQIYCHGAVRVKARHLVCHAGLARRKGFWDTDGQEQERIEWQELAYIMIVQGKEASTHSKVVVEHTLDDIASAILFEALNGYSCRYEPSKSRREMLIVTEPSPVNNDFQSDVVWMRVKVSSGRKCSYSKRGSLKE